MISNPDKFHSIILTKNKDLDLEVRIGDQTIKFIDNKLNFEKHRHN